MMTLLEFLKSLFATEPLDNFQVQKAPQKEISSSTDEEEEFVAFDITEEEEEFFI